MIGLLYVYTVGSYDKPNLKVIGLFANRFVHQKTTLQIVAKLNLYQLIIFANRYMVVCQHLFNHHLYMVVFNHHLHSIQFVCLICLLFL